MPQTLPEIPAGSDYSNIVPGNRRGTGIGEQKLKPGITAHELLQEIHIPSVHEQTPESPTETITQNLTSCVQPAGHTQLSKTMNVA